MSDSNLVFKTRLKQNGYSVTHSRLEVFSALQNREPISMSELIRACGNQLDRASVYRSVELFERLGIIQRLSIGWKYKLELSSIFSDHHHHLSCSQCGRVIVIPEDPVIENRLRSLAAAMRFEDREHQIEISGLCGQCRS